jgi:predicted proteasome-type protease
MSFLQITNGKYIHNKTNTKTHTHATQYRLMTFPLPAEFLIFLLRHGDVAILSQIFFHLITRKMDPSLRRRSRHCIVFTWTTAADGTIK